MRVHKALIILSGMILIIAGVSCVPQPGEKPVERVSIGIDRAPVNSEDGGETSASFYNLVSSPGGSEWLDIATSLQVSGPDIQLIRITQRGFVPAFELEVPIGSERRFQVDLFADDPATQCPVDLFSTSTEVNLLQVQEVELRLPPSPAPAVVVNGRVHTQGENPRPVSGAKLLLHDIIADVDMPLPPALAVSGADGLFAIPCVPAGRKYILTALDFSTNMGGVTRFDTIAGEGVFVDVELNMSIEEALASSQNGGEETSTSSPDENNTVTTSEGTFTVSLDVKPSSGNVYDVGVPFDISLTVKDDNGNIASINAVADLSASVDAELSQTTVNIINGRALVSPGVIFHRGGSGCVYATLTSSNGEDLGEVSKCIDLGDVPENITLSSTFYQGELLIGAEGVTSALAEEPLTAQVSFNGPNSRFVGGISIHVYNVTATLQELSLSFVEKVNASRMEDANSGRMEWLDVPLAGVTVYVNGVSNGVSFEEYAKITDGHIFIHFIQDVNTGELTAKGTIWLKVFSIALNGEIQITCQEGYCQPDVGGVDLLGNYSASFVFGSGTTSSSGGSTDATGTTPAAGW